MKAFNRTLHFLGFILLSQQISLFGQGFTAYPKGWQLMPNGQVAAMIKQQASESTNQAESAMWKKATIPFSMPDTKAYLDKYPHGEHAKDAQAIVDDEKIIEAVETKGPENRYVIPKELWPPFIANAISSRTAFNDKRDRALIKPMKGTPSSIVLADDHVETTTSGGNGVVIELSKGWFCLVKTNNPAMFGPWKTPRNDVVGAAPMPENYIFPLLPAGDHSVFIVNGRIWNVVGDFKEPLRLLYSDQKGLIHIGGKGKILDFSGNTIFETPPATNNKSTKKKAP